MPDSLDYQWLGHLLADPHRWSEADAAAARSILENQKRALSELHARDANGRRNAQELIDQLESALRLYSSMMR
jgi:hypothetical protein